MIMLLKIERITDLSHGSQNFKTGFPPYVLKILDTLK